MKLGFLIPTRNRKEDLTRLLSSLQKQTRKPDYLLVIDGSDPDKRIKAVVDRFTDLPLHYLEVFPPGLTKQRNLGLREVPKDLELIGFLDDDLELFPDAIEKMMDFWETADAKFGGASFNIVNNIFVNPTIFHRLFLINNGKGGTFMPSGINLILHPVKEDTETEWLSGGATVWRREILDTHKFEERYKGYGALDDIDFSLSLSKKWRLMVLRDAKVHHHTHPIRSEKMKHYGEFETVNRFFFVKRFGFSVPAFFWAMVGRILAYSFKGVVKARKEDALFALGHVTGLLQIMTGRENIKAEDMK